MWDRRPGGGVSHHYELVKELLGVDQPQRRSMADIRETAILIDHDRSEVRVDTNNRGMVGRLTRMGFVDVTRSDSDSYRRFVGTAKQIGFRKVRILSPEQRAIAGKRLQNRSNASKKPGIPSTGKKVKNHA